MFYWFFILPVVTCDFITKANNFAGNQATPAVTHPLFKNYKSIKASKTTKNKTANK